MRGVILLSGGLDSATLALMKKREGYELHAITFEYGQKHRVEIDRARLLARHLSLERHLVLELPRELFSGSALTGSTETVPENREIDGSIPSTYVPARNLVFLSLASAYAESCGIFDIFIAVNALDYSGYPDCRPPFIDGVNRLLQLGTKTGIEERSISVHAPLINLSKADIILTANNLGLDFKLTSSCYNPDEQGRPCGKCDSCLLRKQGFSKAGIVDPLEN